MAAIAAYPAAAEARAPTANTERLNVRHKHVCQMFDTAKYRSEVPFIRHISLKSYLYF